MFVPPLVWCFFLSKEHENIPLPIERLTYKCILWFCYYLSTIIVFYLFFIWYGDFNCSCYILFVILLLLFLEWIFLWWFYLIFPTSVSLISPFFKGYVTTFLFWWKYWCTNIASKYFMVYLKLFVLVFWFISLISPFYHDNIKILLFICFVHYLMVSLL